jgi:phage shock protein A
MKRLEENVHQLKTDLAAARQQSSANNAKLSKPRAATPMRTGVTALATGANGDYDEDGPKRKIPRKLVERMATDFNHSVKFDEDKQQIYDELSNLPSDLNGVVQLLCRSLPRIIPNILLNKRDVSA